MKARTLPIAAVLGLAVLAHAQTPAPSSAPLARFASMPAAPPSPPPSPVPANLQVPAGEKLILKAHATGWQVYTCGPGADGKAQWTLKGPDAELHDGLGAVIGHHSTGPTWTYKDGSQIIGKAVAHADAPDSKSVAWLLLTAIGHSGDGLFSHVTSVQRLATQGGQPPPATECDPSKPSPEARSSYTADYYFYSPEK